MLEHMMCLYVSMCVRLCCNYINLCVHRHPADFNCVYALDDIIRQIRQVRNITNNLDKKTENRFLS